ncbi:hypothetical protein O181_002385 [Austropuccinia psidii MF-1]|uniref:Uncharacterized protein n=1 Tax=Austropuccinia psidii MF-1 TaxID=1389203 RepID=A0A9Q3GCS8_9BASI|nr:hypothetical protein [Austropuccinia psidii MF-1]
MQPIDEIRNIDDTIDVKLGKFEREFKKLTSNFNDLKNNYRTFSELCKVKNARLESIFNTCDRIENKCQAKIDELKDLFINHIDDQLTILKNHVLEIFYNTNPLAKHLERRDSERKKLKNQTIAHVEKIHKNYEPNSHMLRHSTPLTEEKCSFKESSTPFLGENSISERDISKL